MNTSHAQTKSSSSSFQTTLKWIAHGSLARCLLILVGMPAYVIAGMTYPKYDMGHGAMLRSEDRKTAQLYRKEEGTRIVKGQITRMSYEPGSGRNIVTAAYLPQRDDGPPPSPSEHSRPLVARVDLRTLTVTEVPDPDGSIGRKLQPVENWMWLYPLNFF